MDRLALPVFFSVTVCVALVPVVKLPKLRELGDTESGGVDATPVPEKERTYGELGELFISVRLPEKLVAEPGAKLTVNDAEPPGATESGAVIPE